MTDERNFCNAALHLFHSTPCRGLNMTPRRNSFINSRYKASRRYFRSYHSPRIFYQFHLWTFHVWESIDSHRNPASCNWICGIIAHCWYDVISGEVTSRWCRDVKPHRNSFKSDQDMNFLWNCDLPVFIVKTETSPLLLNTSSRLQRWSVGDQSKHSRPSEFLHCCMPGVRGIGACTPPLKNLSTDLFQMNIPIWAFSQRVCLPNFISLSQRVRRDKLSTNFERKNTI